MVVTSHTNLGKTNKLFFRNSQVELAVIYENCRKVFGSLLLFHIKKRYFLLKHHQILF